MSAKATPGTRAAERAGVAFTLHAYEHDPRSESFAQEAAEALAIAPERVFKTLVVTRGNELLVCVVPASSTLDLRSLGKGTAMAPVARAEKVTGYVAGGISPLGQRKALPTLLDDSALGFETIYVSAGRRGLEIELAPRDLAAITNATVQRLRAD